MPMYFPPWDTDAEPSEGNIKNWMDNLYGKFEPLEQARWNQSNIDSLFYAGEQRFINSYFNFYPSYNYQTFHFNLIQQPVNMITGYQRQHRKSVNYTPIEGSHQESADDMTKLVMYANNYGGILEKFSQACEQSAISGMVLLQPYLDYTDDPINGSLNAKVWSYNSFMVDPYFREPDMSDCNFVWGQQYVSKSQAIDYFPDRAEQIRSMSGMGNRNGKFYFLPENYNLARNDLLVLSNVWFRSKRKKRMLYNRNDGVTYEYTDDQASFYELIANTGFFEEIHVEVPTWKQAVVLNEQAMFIGDNPMGFDECPFIPVYWNRDPHLAQYDLRVRSLVKSMRDTQFLLNRRIILNHDISESSINSGWIVRENSVVNEEDLLYGGQGKNLTVKDNGQPLSESVQKIIPNQVPPSDMQLADQLADFVFRTSGVNQELMGMSDDSKTGIEVMLRQGAGLVTLQKYFDQWDMALKLLGKLEMRIIQNKWSPSKMMRILGKEPTAEFLNKTFSKFDVIVSEGLNTTIQQQMQFKQMLELDQMLGGNVIPKKFILESSTIQGKNKIIEAVEAQEKAVAEAQKEQMMIEHAKLEAELQNIHAKSANELAMARERHGRAESNVGLFEERLSEITQNRSMALKNKVDALEKLLAIIQQYGELEASTQAAKLQSENMLQKDDEHTERLDAKANAESNQFLTNMLQNNPTQNNMGPSQQNAESLRSAFL